MKNWKIRLSAAVVTLYLLANFDNACWAASTAGSERFIESSIVTIYDGNPLIQLKPSKNSNGNDVALTVSPDLQVSLNGHRVDLNQLKPGDSVKTFVRSGSAFRMDATRRESGIVVGMNKDTIYVSTDYVTIDDFFTDTDCSIRLGGQPATWADLKRDAQCSVLYCRSSHSAPGHSRSESHFAISGLAWTDIRVQRDSRNPALYFSRPAVTDKFPGQILKNRVR